MAKCSRCNETASVWQMKIGLCPKCFVAYQAERGYAAERQTDEPAQEDLSAIILTTEASHNLPVSQRLDIVTAEVVIGMHLFKDIGAVFRDVFGGRSETMQRGLKDARKAALAELRLEAFELGADAVVGIDLDYSEISGGGKSMLFLVASGTAVKLHPSA